MKKCLILICTIIIFSHLLIGCSSAKDVEFKEIYADTISYKPIDENSKPVSEETILMMANQDFEMLKDNYIMDKKIQTKSLDKDKAVLYIQMPGSKSSVKLYKVKDIKVNEDTLTVQLDNYGADLSISLEGDNSIHIWTMLVELDKTNLNDDMKIVVKK